MQQKSSERNNFIVIDDDSINNHICSKYLEHVFPESEVVTFLDPLFALEYIRQHYDAPDSGRATLFLDINMPIISGWDVLDRFELFPDHIKEKTTIYISYPRR